MGGNWGENFCRDIFCAFSNFIGKLIENKSSKRYSSAKIHPTIFHLFLHPLIQNNGIQKII
jgi:hypothetical protein